MTSKPSQDNPAHTDVTEVLTALRREYGKRIETLRFNAQTLPSEQTQFSARASAYQAASDTISLILYELRRGTPVNEALQNAFLYD